MLENAKRWVNPINTSNKAKKIRRSMMAGLATFAVAVLPVCTDRVVCG